jgi:UDP-glucose 4-epimerase
MKLNGKTVAVTGGAGFIGSHLCHHLIREGAKIIAIDNFLVGKKEFVPDGVTIYKSDIRSEEVKHILQEFKPNIILHLAAIHYIPYCNSNPAATFEVNVMGTKNILESIGDAKLLFASSAAVYPPLSGPLSENLSGPIDIYGKTKIIGEDLVKLYSPNAIIARFFNVYGPNDLNPHLIPELINQVKGGSREIALGNLTPCRDYIHVTDLCRAIIVMLKNDSKGTFNIGTGIEYSVENTVQFVSEILGEKLKIVIDRERIRPVEREHLRADITKIENSVEWKPEITFKEGLRQLIIFKKQKNKKNDSS